MIIIEYINDRFSLVFYTSIAAVSNTFPPKTFALRNGKKSIFCSAICIRWCYQKEPNAIMTYTIIDVLLQCIVIILMYRVKMK